MMQRTSFKRLFAFERLKSGRAATYTVNAVDNVTASFATSTGTPTSVVGNAY